MTGVIVIVVFLHTDDTDYTDNDGMVSTLINSRFFSCYHCTSMSTAFNISLFSVVRQNSISLSYCFSYSRLP